MMLAMIDNLESRRLFAAPAVVAVTLAGTAGQLTGIVLTFAMPLDPASAQNVNAYSISKRVKGEESSVGPVDTGSGGSTRSVRFSSAVYDPATQSVTLTPADAFDLGRRFKRLRVLGGGTNAVRDAAGVPIDGNGDGQPGGHAIIHSRILRGPGFIFREADGDRARLRLAGRGTLRVWSDARRNIAPVVFLFGTDPQRSSLTGNVVRNRRGGDGVVTLRQISGTSLAAVPLLNNPAFRVEVVNP